MSKPAIFLDRDGTLNRQVIRDGKPFPPDSLAEFELFPEAAGLCRALHQAGYLLVVVTNQPDVGRGTQKPETVAAMHARLQEQIPEIARVEVCFDPDDKTASPRRKPSPGMILDAAKALDIDLSRSWMVGDRWRDVDCGKRAGLKTIFIDFGYGESLREKPDFVVKGLREVASILLPLTTPDN